MAEKLPDNLEEALKYIRKQQAEITELKATVDKQNIMLSNLSEMLVKSRKAMSVSPVSSSVISTVPSRSTLQRLRNQPLKRSMLSPARGGKDFHARSFPTVLNTRKS